MSPIAISAGRLEPSMLVIAIIVGLIAALLGWHRNWEPV